MEHLAPRDYIVTVRTSLQTFTMSFATYEEADAFINRKHSPDIRKSLWWNRTVAQHYQIEHQPAVGTNTDAK